MRPPSDPPPPTGVAALRGIHERAQEQQQELQQPCQPRQRRGRRRPEQEEQQEEVPDLRRQPARPTTPPAPRADHGAKEKRIAPLLLTVLLGGGGLVAAARAYNLSVVDRLRGVGLLTAVAVVVLFATCPPLPQPLAYHNFADQRCLCCGVPNTFDVMSNLPFAAVSVFGIDHVLGGTVAASAGFNVPPAVFIERAVELPLWLTFFAGVGLIAIGSAYYHLRPTNARLVWDRLPMTIAFCSFLAVVLSDTVLPAAMTNQTLGGLLVIGGASVVYWAFTDDLRPYVLVQFYFLALTMLLIALFPSRYEGVNTEYVVALAWYVGAKVAEALDKPIFKFTGGRISGHTIKHLLSGVTTLWASVALMRRRQLQQP